MKLRITGFQTNTKETGDGSCETRMYTGMLDRPTCEFAGSHGGVHVIEGWYYDYGRHATKYDINVPAFAAWLHAAEFKEPSEAAEELVRDDDDDMLREASLGPAVEGIIEQIMGDDVDEKPNGRLWAESLDTAIKAAVERLTSDTGALWPAYLDRILWDASYLDKPEQLNKNSPGRYSPTSQKATKARHT